MSNVFFASDHHIGHGNMMVFRNADGTGPLRPFRDADHMDEELIERHNAVVKPFDNVYFLGDVVINKKHLHKVAQMNGKKRLVRGNHDIFPTANYLEYFDEIYGVRVLDDMILSHIPLHPDSVTTRFRTNVHGHLHGNRVMRAVGGLDPRYYSVCMEQIDYTPIALEDLRVAINKQRDDAGYTSPKPWANGSVPSPS